MDVDSVDEVAVSVWDVDAVTAAVGMLGEREIEGVDCVLSVSFKD